MHALLSILRSTSDWFVSHSPTIHLDPAEPSFRASSLIEPKLLGLSLRFNQ